MTRVLDLGMQPVSNAFIPREKEHEPETFYPLSMYVCESCKLAQLLHDQVAHHHFNEEYVYFSSMTQAFVDHAKSYVDTITDELGLGKDSFVVEAASNDGYLLQHFHANGVPHLGVEPSGSTAEVARSRGVNTLVDFFSVKTAERVRKEYGSADLVLGNNVLAHVPDIDDFLGGIATLLKDGGTATLEFPHLLKLMEERQFDTIYHEHYSYISLIALIPALERRGLRLYKVEEVSVHGGSLRVFFAKASANMPEQPSVGEILAKERAAGLDRIETYEALQRDVDELCRNAVKFLIDAEADGKTVAGYGAAAKGNTFLNYCGIKPHLMPYVCDVTPAKQGKLLPGTRIEVLEEEALRERKPDYIFILPWNWRDSIAERLSFTREWGCKFVVAVPELDIF